MNQPDPNIELDPQPARIQNPIAVPVPRQFHYQPQEDEEPHTDDEEIHQEPQIPPQRPHSLEFCSQLWFKFCSEKLTNITLLLILLLYIIILGTGMVALFNLSQQENKIAEMKDLRKGPFRVMSENLNADPIMEIRIIDQESICPANFAPLKLSKWAGTVTGCYCETGDLLNTECKNANPRKCKKEVPAMNPIEMYVWENSVFCVKRASLEADYIRKAECPKGYQECYPGGCFKEECPITQINIASKGEEVTKFNNKEKYLISTKQQGELPLINIQITLDDIPCFIRDLFGQNITDLAYILSADMLQDTKRNECDKYGYDGNMTNKLDSQAAYAAYTQNSFQNSAMSMPYFESYAKETSSVLSSTVRMKTAKHDYCLDIKEIAPVFSDTFDYPAFQSIHMTWGVLIFLILNLCTFISGCERLRLWKNSSELIEVSFKFQLLMYFYLIFGFAWRMTVPQRFRKIKEAIQEYDSLGCFEGSQGSMAIRDYLELARDVEGDFWMPIVISLSHILIFLTIMCYFIIKSCR